MDMTFRTGLTGHYLEQTQEFLRAQGLDWDAHIHSTALLTEDGKIFATGSRHENVLKCIAVAKEREGEGLMAAVVTELVKDALRSGYAHLFLFTKPDYVEAFGALGFHPVAQTRDAAMLENRKDGVAQYVKSLPRPINQGEIGAIVANCNPFTNGHRYLIETAARRCDLVHLFLVSEDRSDFDAKTRMELAKRGTADLANVIVHPTGDYLISAATFPDYFIKDKAQAKQINCALDLTVFARCFAKPMSITTRFVGSEPTDLVTASYNWQMREILPQFGIAVAEIPRCEQDSSPVSASKVRALLKENRLEEIRALVPQSTFAYLEEIAKHGSSSVRQNLF